MRKFLNLYLAVTADEYEFPLFVGDSLQEMAKWSGLTYGTISKKIKNKQAYSALNCKFVKVKIKKGGRDF